MRHAPSLILSAVALLIAGCAEEPRPTPRFGFGQMVQMAAFGTTGMVVDVSCWRGTKHCYYDVRFASLEVRTNTRLLGADGAVTFAPIARVNNIAEFELRAAE